MKRLIKDRTTPGKGKSVSVPGRGEEKSVDFENTLFVILEDQHHRIDLFVKSKTGEIQRRLDHAKRQLKQLSARKARAAEAGIPIARLERYSRLESDVLKAGDEIRSLARFTGTQRTAFRKLLKKYKKWTGSTNLEVRFRDEVLDDPKSFTKLDLGPLLDDYSETLQDIRNLYENRIQQAAARRNPKAAPPTPAQSTIEQFKEALRDQSRVQFDTAIATIPLGQHGEIANYFVHPENVVELQILLLQYMEYYTSRSRNNSAATPVSPLTPTRSFSNPTASPADYFMLVADDSERLAQEQSAVTVSKREHAQGVVPQMAKAFIRWNNAEEGVLSIRSTPVKVKSASLKRKHIDTFFDKNAPPPKKVEVNDGDTLLALRTEIMKDRAVRPLYRLSTCRSRFSGINVSAKSLTLATFDSSIVMKAASDTKGTDKGTEFPFAVLQVRKEGAAACELISALNTSHLVERVRGFSLQYHALWQICNPKNIPAPFWTPMLSEDIRKLPPPALTRNDSLTGSGSGTRSAANGSASSASAGINTDSTTAVESSILPGQLEAPPLRAFRKKRRRPYAEQQMQQQQRYWSEYDHPEDTEDGGDAFFIYIDPNEKSAFDRFFDKIGSFFAKQDPVDDESQLPSPRDDDQTSDEEDTLLEQDGGASYGTLPSSSSRHRARNSSSAPYFFPHVTSICLAASISILIVAYILTQTSKHKYVAEVDVGIIFAAACSLAFAIIGFIPFMRRREDASWLAFGMATAIVAIDVMGCGFLLAWILSGAGLDSIEGRMGL